MSGVSSSARRPSHTNIMIRRPAGPVSCCCACTPLGISSSRRALSKTTSRVVMVRLLGSDASGDNDRSWSGYPPDWLSQERVRGECVSATLCPPCLGVQCIIVLFFMHSGDKQNGPEAPADLRCGSRPRHGFEGSAASAHQPVCFVTAD